MPDTYRVDGLLYRDLTDLLSTGWPEDKMVELMDSTGSRHTGDSTIARLRAEFQSPDVYAKRYMQESP